MEFSKIFVASCLIVTSTVLSDSFMFRRNSDCNGQIRCASNKPIFIQNGSLIHCAIFCNSLRICTGFNYLENTSTCQLFDIFPFKIDHQPNCSNYQIFSMQSVNLALCQPSYQSSTLAPDGFVLYSSLVVDGLLGSFANGIPCSHTNDGDGGENWFMVDLIHTVTISYVCILTRDAPAEYSIRYKDLIIGVTNDSWLVKRPVRNTYPLCGIYQGPDVIASWIQINCSVDSTPPTRYVIVQQTPANSIYGGYLSLCEVEVFQKF